MNSNQRSAKSNFSSPARRHESAKTALDGFALLRKLLIHGFGRSGKGVLPSALKCSAIHDMASVRTLYLDHLALISWNGMPEESCSSILTWTSPHDAHRGSVRELAHTDILWAQEAWKWTVAWDPTKSRPACGSCNGAHIIHGWSIVDEWEKPVAGLPMSLDTREWHQPPSSEYTVFDSIPTKDRYLDIRSSCSVRCALERILVWPSHTLLTRVKPKEWSELDAVSPWPCRPMSLQWSNHLTSLQGLIVR